MLRLRSFFTLFIPTFIFLVLFEPAFELYLDFFDVTRYNIYANTRGSSVFKDILFSGFLHPEFCFIALIIALPASIAGTTLMYKKPGNNIFVQNLFLALLLVCVYHLIYLIPSLTYYDHKYYALKLILLGITGFILMLPFSFVAQKRLRGKAAR